MTDLIIEIPTGGDPQLRHNWTVVQGLAEIQSESLTEIKAIRKEISEDSGLEGLIKTLTQEVANIASSVVKINSNITALTERIEALEGQSGSATGGTGASLSPGSADIVETPLDTKYMIDRFGSDIFADYHGINKLKSILWDITQTGMSFEEGLMAWDDDAGTLNLGMKGGVVRQQIGEEIYLQQ